MKKKQIDSNVAGVGTFWSWEMPELINEIPELFSEAGTAKILKAAYINHWVCVEVTLKEPAKVVDWRKEKGDGLVINYVTNSILACRNGVSPAVRTLPVNGDEKIVLGIQMELYTFLPEEIVTLDDLRHELRELAKAMNKTWCYVFS